MKNEQEDRLGIFVFLGTVLFLVLLFFGSVVRDSGQSTTNRTSITQTNTSWLRSTSTTQLRPYFEAPFNAVGAICRDGFIDSIYARPPCENHWGIDSWKFEYERPDPKPWPNSVPNQRQQTTPLTILDILPNSLGGRFVIRSIPDPPFYEIITVPSVIGNQAGVRVGAICNDGWQSSATGSGACSHHGGVAYWLYG